MSVIEIGDAKVTKLKVNGVEYSLREPTVEDTEFLQSLLEKAESESSKFKATKEFISRLGLPMEVIGKLAVSQMEAISEAVAGKKK